MLRLCSPEHPTSRALIFSLFSYHSLPWDGTILLVRLMFAGARSCMLCIRLDFRLCFALCVGEHKANAVDNKLTMSPSADYRAVRSRVFHVHESHEQD